MMTLAKETGKALHLPCLKIISVGRAYDLLRADVQEHLRLVQRDIRFSHCRFHALFHDDMDVVYRREDGSLGYHWHHIDKVYDFLLSVGLKPFVELGSMPRLLASGEQTMFWYRMNVTPPKDMGEWSALVKAFAVHVTRRYGAEEVKNWFFEVWNEPNLECFWSGSQQEYFDLYKAAAQAVKEVCPDYRVGGPATAVAAWIEDMIAHCTDQSIPLDFISTHVYPQDEYCLYKTREASPYPIGRYFIDTVKGVKDAVAASRRPELPIYWTEFNTLTADANGTITFLSNTALDRLYGAACVVHYMVNTMEYSDGVSWWTASDIFEEDQMSHAPFSGTYGLLTIHGIKKATYNAYTLLRRMRGQRVTVAAEAVPIGCGILAAREADTLRLLLWNCHLPEIANPPIWTDIIRIPDLPANWIGEQATIRAGQGSPYEAWLAMGKPANLTPFQEAYLRSRAEMEYTPATVTDNGVTFSLQPDEIRYIELHSPAETAGHAVNDHLEQQLTPHF